MVTLDPMADSPSTPPEEITNALAALARLRAAGVDVAALQKTLPPLARRLAQAGEDISVDALFDHASQGADHIRTLYDALATAEKAPPRPRQKTYDEIIAAFPLPPETVFEEAFKVFKQAIEQGDIALDLIESFIAQGVNKELMLAEAIKYIRINSVVRLMDVGASISVKVNGYDPLSWAAKNRHFDMARFFLRRGADVHANNDGPLSWAVVNDDIRMARLFLRHKADICSGRNKPFFAAIEKLRINIIDLFLEHGASLDILDASERKKVFLMRMWQRKHGFVPQMNTLPDPSRVNGTTMRFVHGLLKKEGVGSEQTAWSYAYNAAALFGSQERVLHYLEKHGRYGKQPLHDVIQMISIPSPKDVRKYNKPDMKVWRDAVIQCGPEMAGFVKFSHRLPQPLKDRSGRFWSWRNTGAAVAGFAFVRGHEHPELAQMGLRCKWVDGNFNAALRVVETYSKKYAQSNGRKPDGNIPAITIPGADFDKGGFTFCRLPDGDIRGLALGAFTACCQHIGGEGRECAEHGFLSPHAGFYVVANDKSGEIVGQSWAWRGLKGELVLDSLEYLPSHMNKTQWKKLCTIFAERAADAGIKAVHLGTGGNTPEGLGFPTAREPAVPRDYDDYRDSEGQCILHPVA